MFKLLRERIGAAQGAVPWGIGAVLGALVAAFAAVMIGTTAALGLLGETDAASLVGWSLAAALTLLFIHFTYRKPAQKAALQLGTLRAGAFLSQDTLLLLLIGVGLAVTLDIISGRITGKFLPEPELIQTYTTSLYTGQGIPVLTWLLALLFMVILQPLAEELLFRGLALPALRRMLGAWPGYLLSAVLYGLFHLLVYPQALEGFPALWYGCLSVMVAGLVFGAVRLYNDSTRAAVLVHAAFGLFALVKLLTLLG